MLSNLLIWLCRLSEILD